jgi:NADH-quinone oxidoreductase subunit C
MDKALDIQALEKLAEHIHAKVGDKVLEQAVQFRELTLVCSLTHILDVLKFLRDDSKCQFRILLDVCGVDWPEKEPRFEVVYHLLSVKHNQRVAIKVPVSEGDSVPSATGLFSSANWYERETYDMFGISFENHPDLRRILTDYDFDGFPLRKDFPVEGKVEIYYDEKEERVAYKPVDLPQEYRHFDKQSPWEAMTGNASRSESDSVFDADEFKGGAK